MFQIYLLKSAWVQWITMRITLKKPLTDCLWELKSRLKNIKIERLIHNFLLFICYVKPIQYKTRLYLNTDDSASHETYLSINFSAVLMSPWTHLAPNSEFDLILLTKVTWMPGTVNIYNLKINLNLIHKKFLCHTYIFQINRLSLSVWTVLVINSYWSNGALYTHIIAYPTDDKEDFDNQITKYKNVLHPLCIFDHRSSDSKI